MAGYLSNRWLLRLGTPLLAVALLIAFWSWNALNYTAGVIAYVVAENAKSPMTLD